MLLPEIGRALERHRAAGEAVRGLDLRPGEAERGQEVKARRVVALGRDLERLRQRLDAERPFVEDEADVESPGERRLDLVDRCLGRPLAFSAAWLTPGACASVARPTA